MPDGEQMNPVLFHLEGVNDAVVANAGSKTIRSLQPMMWKRFEPQPDFIDFRFNPCTQSGWQLEENGIETLVVNLSRCVDSCAPAHFDLSVLPIYVARVPAAPFVRFPAYSLLPSSLYLDHSHCPVLVPGRADLHS